jgi:CBS domain-containing protein
MVKHVITLPPMENLWKAHNTMTRYRIKKVVVVTQNKIVHNNGVINCYIVFPYLLHLGIELRK